MVITPLIGCGKALWTGIAPARLQQGNGNRYLGVTGGQASFDDAPAHSATSGATRMRVLIVEDHKELAATIAVGLRREGMAVDLAFDGREALRHTARESYDVVVLDRDLPKLHGDQVCSALVAGGSHARVLMLTASATIENRVDGLSLGADDYLPKPFAFAELVARIRALARRNQPALRPVLVTGDLRLDTAQRLATRSGRRLELSPKELAVLELLLAADGATVSTEELLRRAWDKYAGSYSNVVKVTIARLRRKLGDPPAIETVPHAGYRICA
jgi:DNA-binding response OmpR family regulator